MNREEEVDGGGHSGGRTWTSFACQIGQLGQWADVRFRENLIAASMTEMVKGFGFRQAYESLSCRKPRSAFCEPWGCFVFLGSRGGAGHSGVRRTEAGIHRTYIGDLERGARNPTIKVIEKLAKALAVSQGDLLN